MFQDGNEIIKEKYSQKFFKQTEFWKYMHPASIHKDLQENDIWSIKGEKVITSRPHFTEMHCDSLGSSKYTCIPKSMENYGFKIELVSYQS